ncbi:MAG: hypothetical protein HRU21_09785 [Pseudomonadales bacterium]|nr:hypothetical protein [Pseudomonadales bacterium]
MTELKEKQKRQHDLVRKVFSTPDGAKLLDELVEAHILVPQLHPDPNTLYSRIGQQELVVHFLTITKGKL